MPGTKCKNEYVRHLGILYHDIPTAMWATIAFSLALRVAENRPDDARREILKEWRCLRDNERARQNPLTTLDVLIDEVAPAKTERERRQRAQEAQAQREHEAHDIDVFLTFGTCRKPPLFRASD